MGAIASAIDRVRQPEYTGENRCYPCTAVNLVIALVVAVGVVLLVRTTAWAAYGLLAGNVAFLVCLVPIVLRGYLVPGTPTITKRYFPPWLLAFFDKEPQTTSGLADDGPDGDGDEIDVEQRLLTAGALEPMPDGEDLRLASSLREDWRSEMEAVRDSDADRERLIEVLGAPEGYLSFETYGDSFRASIDGVTVGTWESRGAFVADVAAAPVLEARIDDWEQLSVPDRGRLLNGLRLFLEACPTCDGPLSFGTNTVESCCSTHEVAALTCDDCGERIFESQPL